MKMMSDSIGKHGAREAVGGSEADSDQTGRSSATPRTVSSVEVLGEAQEVVIDHEGQTYRLRRTSQGKLILTNQRIYFLTKTAEEVEFNKEILPTDIEEIMFFNSLKILPNGLSIITKEGQDLRFQVKKRNEWGEMINKIY